MGYFGIPFRNGVPIGLGSIVGFGAPQEFSPSELFVGGTAGAWYDPSDLTTLFTTSAGTTQCAMPGQGSAVSVGLMLDKSQGVQRFWSGYFDGTGDYLSTAASAGIAFGTGDFTIEGWCYSFDVSSSTQRGIFQTSDTAGGLKPSYPTGVTLVFGSSGSGSLGAQVGGTAYSSAGALVRASTWFHFAVTRASGAVNIWLNGVSVASGAGNTANLIGQFAAIGGYYNTTYLLNGYVSNFRIVKGTAIYTGTFTPPSPVTGLTAISGTSLLTCQNSTFIDNSGNNVAITVNGNTTTSQNIPLGNHAIAFNDTTARPELRARVNLLTYSEEFDNAAWTKTNATAANTSATTDPLGGASADLIYPNITGACRLYQAASGISSVYNATIYVKYAGVQWVRIYSADNASSAWFDVQNGVVGTVNPGVTAPTPTAVGNGWYRLSVAKTSAALFFQIDLVDGNNSTTVTAAGTNGVYIWGADLRPANIGANVPAYQRIADANTYDTSGFPLYLRFDGIDDSMYTPANLNLSGTDKATVFAGVRKLSDAAAGIIVQNFDSTPGGVISLSASPSSTAAYFFRSAGTADSSGATPTNYAAPISNVLTGIGEISTDTRKVRVNGVEVVNSATDQGTGNYGTYPLFIGARNNSSVFLNGHLYSLAVVGSAVSAGNISATEQWVAGKTGIVIP